MSWNMAPECVSSVVLCIIWIYSRKGTPIPSLKNRLFQISFLTTFCAMTSNILSTVLIYFLSPYTLALTWLINMIYFLSTPLMGMVYFFYLLATLYEGDPHVHRYLFFTSIPGLAYVLMVLLNPFTRNIFDITLARGYSQSKYIAVTYLIFYFYCLCCVVAVIWKGRKVSSSIRSILFAFPLIAAVVVVIQQLVPGIILSGSAATCALLMIYLYLQNKQSSIDHLTGIPNRQEFLKMLELDLKKQGPFVILVLSLRDFKSVNDVYGQQNGDAFLAAISNFLHKKLGLKEGELFRYSGDEFALLLKNASDYFLAEKVDQLLVRMTQPWEARGRTAALSAAIGVVRYPETSDKMDELLNGIEYAVERAKTEDTNLHVCYCTPELLEKAKRRQTIAGILKDSLQNDGFEIYYQPILSVKSHSFFMAEALLRIRHSPIGFISPGEFIPIAESSGLIVEITYMVLDKVCGDIHALLERGIQLDGISVNFSALQFTQMDLLDRITQIIHKHAIPFSKIKVELTESALAENPETITDLIHQLHALGIRIGLDDFGTGYSNLTSVIDQPIDTVKLDKSLVWSSMTSDRVSSLVRNLTRAFRELGIHVLAEGVENEQQSQFVIECGCGMIQGFLYARPMPSDAYFTFMEEHSNQDTALLRIDHEGGF